MAVSQFCLASSSRVLSSKNPTSSDWSDKVYPNNEVVERPTRRQFLRATSAAVLAAGNTSFLSAAKASAPAKNRRMNLSDPANATNVKYFEDGVAAMIALPPEDTRNWYRFAMIHLVDCPHGNWWFLPWHRGYIGWLEAIIRELTGAKDFALPYWDWTALPRLPESFVSGKLNPANFPIAGFMDFKAKFEKPFNDYFNALNAAQLAQLKLRNYMTPDSVWASIEHAASNPMFPSIFSDIANVRALNPPNSPIFSATTARAVALATILDAMGPRQFLDFSSGKSAAHQLRAVQGVLESQPHNNVHGEVGGGSATSLGFMSAFLSPVDPIFFMHHTNLDRLWDVWTRKQQALGQQAVDLMTGTAADYPIFPIGPDLDLWNNEPFLFFVGADGKFVAQTTSGGYTSTSFFDYDYQPASGEVVVPTAPAPRNALAGQSFAAAMESRVASLAQPSNATTKMPGAVLQAAGQANGVRVVAEITAEYPPNTEDTQLVVLVNVPPGTRNVQLGDPSYAGTYRPFGTHQHAGMADQPSTVTFRVGLTDSLQRLAAAKRLAPGDDIKVSVVPDLPGVQLNASVNITNITIKTY
jgi:hypothetical protein